MNKYYRGPASDHFDGERFFNPGHETTDKGLSDILGWKLKEKAARWPRAVDVRQTVPDARVAGARVTAVGHATLLIQLDGLNLLTDPVWSGRASPTQWFGPKRVTAPGIALDSLPPIDAVLLSHNHYDHLDLATLARLVRDHDPLIVTPLGNDVIVRGKIPHARIVAGDWGDKVDLAGMEIHIVPAQHWSSRGLSDRRMALWGGFMLRSKTATIYFAGDTGYGDGAIFRAIRATHGAPDLALIPIGAYEPRWFMAAQHCNPEEAVRIMLDLEAKRAIGIHWGTFQLTDEARDAPVVALAESLARHGVDPARFQAAVPGERYQGAGMKYRHFLFDLDDTLLDFKASEKQSFDRTLALLGLEAETAAIFPHYQRENLALWSAFEQGQVDKDWLKVERFRRAFAHGKVEADPHEASTHYLDLLPETVVLVDGAARLCERLAGIGEIGIITNGIETVQARRIANAGLGQWLSFVATSETCGHAKPDARFFDYAARKFRSFAKPEAIIVGDRLDADIAGGCGFGIDSCWFNPLKIERGGDFVPTYEVAHLDEIEGVLSAF